MPNPRGRPPKPAAIKILEGNRSRVAIPPELPLSGVPQCPKELTGEAKKHWEEVAPQLIAVGVAKKLDTSALTLLCMAWQRAVEAKALIEMEPGNPKFYDNERKAWNSWIQIGSRLGMTPSDRQRLTIEADSKDDTELKFFG